MINVVTEVGNKGVDNEDQVLSLTHVQVRGLYEAKERTTGGR